MKLLVIRNKRNISIKIIKTFDLIIKGLFCLYTMLIERLELNDMSMTFEKFL